MRVVLTGGTEPARMAIAAAFGVVEGQEDVSEITGDTLREALRMSDASSVEVRIVEEGGSEVVVDNAGPESQAHPDREVEEGIPEQEPALEGEEALSAGEVAVGEASEPAISEEDAEATAEAQGNDPAAEADADAEAPAEEPEADYEASSEAEELADREGIDLENIEGSGKDGRVLKSDVEAAIAARDEA